MQWLAWRRTAGLIESGTLHPDKIMPKLQHTMRLFHAGEESLFIEGDWSGEKAPEETLADGVQPGAKGGTGGQPDNRTGPHRPRLSDASG
jgi:hypothetical protein